MPVHRIRGLFGVAVLLLASGFATAAPAVASPQHSHHTARHTSHHHAGSPSHMSGGIPQHNGGDGDPDNNGRASDGDGNV